MIVHFDNGARVNAEIARTARERARGLMFRTRLPDGEGMLFDQGTTAVHAFWMINVLIPLDMIFIDERGVVMGIIDHAVPHDATRRGVETPSRYVLEVPGGWAARHGVHAGSSATFDSI